MTEKSIPSKAGMNKPGSRFVIAAAALLAVATGCTVVIPEPQDEFVDGRLRVTYWEKWTGFERDAIERVVNRFNASQNRLFVDLTTVSQIDRKALVAIAGGDPPDVLGLWTGVLTQFAEKRALTCLDPFMERAGMSRDAFIDVFMDMNTYDGRVYALPTTPATTALHWNKSLFAAAGLDPDTPPRTLNQLDEMAERLTEYDRDGNLARLGFTPAEPGNQGVPSWPYIWVYWFGGSLWDGRHITFDTPENLMAYQWVKSYSDKYGAEQLATFQGGFGPFASAENPFFSGKIAMTLQGVWLHNFIDRYAPDMQWGAAPFPSAVPGFNSVSTAETDSICIPAGARHPQEAFEFIKFLCSQENLEMLNMDHRKFSPLKRVTPEFIEVHPNPYIDVFIDLAMSPNVRHAPQLTIWYEYLDELGPAFDVIRFGKALPQEVMPKVQERMSKKWSRQQQRILRRSKVEKDAAL